MVPTCACHHDQAVLGALAAPPERPLPKPLFAEALSSLADATNTSPGNGRPRARSSTATRRCKTPIRFKWTLDPDGAHRLQVDKLAVQIPTPPTAITPPPEGPDQHPPMPFPLFKGTLTPGITLLLAPVC